MGAVFQNFVLGINLADRSLETFIGAYGSLGDAMFLEQSLVGKNCANVDEPRNGIDDGVLVDMRRVPANGDETLCLEIGEVLVQRFNFLARSEIGNPGCS